MLDRLAKIHRRRIPEPDNVRLRLQRLERPVPWPEDLIDEIRAFPAESINQYPEYGAFYRRLSEFVDAPEENLIVGYGIDEMIRNLINIHCVPGDIIAYPYPSYGMFPVYADMFGLRKEQIEFYPGVHVKPSSLFEIVPPDSKIWFLVNPGQVVETLYSEVELIEIANWCRDNGIILAIDEAYYGFGAPTAKLMVYEYDNVIVLRTFSKAMGAAGIRLGYAIAGKTLIEPLQAFRLAGEATAFSMHCATVLMDHWPDVVEPGIQAVCEGRDWLREQLAEMTASEAYGRYANHVLVDMKTPEFAAGIAAQLRLNGVFIRSALPPPLERFLLITAGPCDQMLELTTKFSQAVLCAEDAA